MFFSIGGITFAFGCCSVVVGGAGGANSCESSGGGVLGTNCAAASFGRNGDKRAR